ncbi:hypothetical protein [Legionella sp. 227]|uniref:hypothetical protein n=1 Tax=Legionella sp. 227 TaxID=3367288 RepID=UPI00370D312A
MKRALTVLLTILLLPLTAVGSVALVALMLAMLAVCSIPLILGGTLMAAGELSKKFTDWRYPDMNKTLDPGNGPLITSISTTLILFPFLILPVTAGSVVAAAFISILLVPSMTILGAYKVSEKIINGAEKAINSLADRLNSDQGKARINHSYSILSQDPGLESVVIEKISFEPEITHFNPLFHRKTHVPVHEDTKEDDDTMSQVKEFPSPFASSTDK